MDGEDEEEWYILAFAFTGELFMFMFVETRSCLGSIYEFMPIPQQLPITTYAESVVIYSTRK